MAAKTPRDDEVLDCRRDNVYRHRDDDDLAKVRLKQAIDVK